MILNFFALPISICCSLKKIKISCLLFIYYKRFVIKVKVKTGKQKFGKIVLLQKHNLWNVIQ